MDIMWKSITRLQSKMMDQKQWNRSITDTSKGHQGSLVMQKKTIPYSLFGREEKKVKIVNSILTAKPQTTHMCENCVLFAELNEMEKGNIAFGDNSLAAIQGKGKIEIKRFLEKEVYVEQPLEYEAKGEEDKVLRLKKVISDLKKAPKTWNSRVDKYFREKKYMKCP